SLSSSHRALLSFPTRRSSDLRSRRVGSELRRLREAAGVTTAQAAELLSCSPAKISRIENGIVSVRVVDLRLLLDRYGDEDREHRDRKSTRLNSSHVSISYAVF